MSVSSEGATAYFDAALSTSDYYASERGLWGGKGADRLGLNGDVLRKDFVSLGSNKVPGSEETLTVRTKEARTAGYDFCYSIPKSVSLYLAETGDKTVERMIHESFRETMVDVEDRMEARVRINSDNNRTTGNMVYASFVHNVTRPINGIPDPHYHIHGYTFNATFDGEENRWKAGQFMNLKADAPFYEAAFNARLARKLIEDGYGIRRTDRDFEFASVSRELIEKFSKRTLQIEKLAREKYVVIEARARELMKSTNMEFADAFAQIKSELGSETREKKSASTLTSEQQLENWRSQMTPADRESLKTESVKGLASSDLLESDHAKTLSLSHLFERKSLARELHAAAWFLRRGIGTVDVSESRQFVAADARFYRPDPNGPLVTTKEIREQENRMINKVKIGKGSFQPFSESGYDPMPRSFTLSEEQFKAVDQILLSKDLVTYVHGPAGSGKTSLMQEAIWAIRSTSQSNITVLAPTAESVAVLKKEGFDTSCTLSRFQMADPPPFNKQVIWVDEAGFLSTMQMNWLVDYAERTGTRLILSGDTKQHHGVERGDALRILEECGAVERIELTTIRRQKIDALRAAITDLSQGRTEAGFDKLDEYGAVHEVESADERLNAIAELHAIAVNDGKSSLIVAPTHGECREIADAVRDKQKEEGIISKDEIEFSRITKLNLSESQRSDWMNYEPGQIVEFHKKTKGGFKAGEKWRVIQSTEYGVELSDGFGTRFVPRDKSKAFDVYKESYIRLSEGDTVRITKNFKQGKFKFRNNELAKIHDLTTKRIWLVDGRVIDEDMHLHIDQGIAVTSHASQGKTVDQVIVSAPVASFAQVNQAQFYVSMSRARESMHVFTDSKVALKEAVMRPSARLSPSEIAGAIHQGVPQEVYETVKERVNQQEKEITR